MSELEVRPARSDELAAVGSLTVGGYDEDGYLVRPDGRRDHAYAAWLGDAAGRARDAHLVVAADGAQLLGTVTWCPPGSPLREVTRSPDECEIRTLAVASAARGRGVGGHLVDWCLDRARSAGLRAVLLSSLPEMVPAHRLYASRGFVRRPELDWSPADGVHLWVFERPL